MFGDDKFLPVESKNFTSLAGCGRKSTLLIYKIEMLLDQSRVNLDVKICLV